MKKFLSLVLVLVFAFTLAGCTSGSDTVDDPSDLVIGMSFQDMDNPYFVTMHEAFVEAAESMGATYYVTDASHDVSKQISDIEDLVQKGIDILLINPTDSAGVKGAVEDAHDAGVIVVAIDAQAEGPIDSFVGSKNYDAGYLAGQQLAEDLNGTGTVAILDGIAVVPILERVAGFTAAMDEYPNLTIVGTYNGEQERDVAYDVTEDIMSAHPDLDAIFSVNDGGSLGVLAAIEAAQADIWLYSVDGHPEAVEAILDGDIFKCTVAQYPRDQVRIGLGLAMAIYWGANVVPEALPIDVVPLTKDNAEGFEW